MSFRAYNLNQSLNFSGENLQGRSFKDQNLEGADFSGSDIRGANFAGAILTNANFSNTKAGLKKHWSVISLFLSLFTGFMMGGTVLSSCNLLYSDNYGNRIVGAIVLTGLISFLTISLKEGFANGFIKVTAAIGIVGILVSIFSVSFNQFEIGYMARDTSTIFCLSICSTILTAIFLSLMIAITNNNLVIISLFFSVVSVILIALSAREKVDSIDSNLSQNGWLAITITAGISVLVMLLIAEISKRALAGDSHHAFIRKIAIVVAVISGTNFRGATLTKTNFTEAILRNTNFIEATLTHTIWHQAKKLNLARLDDTILDNPTVRDLLVNKKPSNNTYENASLEEAYLVDFDLKNVNFKNANLSKANLTGANLSKANLTEADLTETNLTGACLQESILAKAQAIGTDFTQADFTGACGLGNWNIDSTTKLDGVNCRFVYLDENSNIERSKRPQSGEFAPREFTKLFQVIVNTIDLIFDDGLNLSALCAALIDVQTEQNTTLEIQNIENKGDGVFVIKVNTLPNADKEKIHSELVQSYEEQLKALESRYNFELQAKDRDIDRYRQRYTDIQEITKLLAEKQVPLNSQPVTEKVVLLKLDSLDETTEILATVQIWVDNHHQPIFFEGKLPPTATIIDFYNRIDNFCNPKKDENNNRAGFVSKPKNIDYSSPRRIYQEIQEIKNLSNELEENINNWLNSPLFLNVANQLRSKLNPSDSIRFIIQTSDIKLNLLPIHLR